DNNRYTQPKRWRFIGCAPRECEPFRPGAPSGTLPEGAGFCQNRSVTTRAGLPGIQRVDFSPVELAVLPGKCATFRLPRVLRLVTSNVTVCFIHDWISPDHGGRPADLG